MMICFQTLLALLSSATCPRPSSKVQNDDYIVCDADVADKYEKFTLIPIEDGLVQLKSVRNSKYCAAGGFTLSSPTFQVNRRYHFCH